MEDEKIDKALFNMTELMKLRREETKLLAKLYIGILQKKYPDTRIMLITPKNYKLNYRMDFKGGPWDANDKKFNTFSWGEEYREKIKPIQVIAIAENKGLIAELKEPDFLRLLGRKDRIAFGIKK